jgi:hypothetical protein
LSSEQEALALLQVRPTGPSISEMIANTPPEQMKAGMALWQAWHQRCGSACIDPGAPLDKSTTVTKESSTSGKTQITGYTILQVDSMEEAVALMKNHPHFFMPGSSAQILECVHMPGM